MPEGTSRESSRNAPCLDGQALGRLLTGLTASAGQSAGQCHRTICSSVLHVPRADKVVLRQWKWEHTRCLRPGHYEARPEAMLTATESRGPGLARLLPWVTVYCPANAKACLVSFQFSEYLM